MIVFDAFLNGKKLQRAGVGTDGVLNAIVSWVKLTGDAARTARRLNQPAEETRLHVGGLSDDTHWRWPGRMLKVGDRVTIAIATAKTFDPPTHQTREHPRVRQQRERRYYLRLKQKYEGQPRRSSRDRRSVEYAHETTFLNVDLDIRSSSPLDALTKAFGKKACVLYAGKEGRHYGAHLELASWWPRDADRVIRRFVRLVDQLPRTSRSVWNRSRVREFNIGIQAGTTPYSHQLHLQPETVLAVARVKARIAVTVYGAGVVVNDTPPSAPAKT